MDLDKLRIFQSGMTEEQRKALENENRAETEFRREADKVSKTVRTKGFGLIVSKMVAEIELIKERLTTCGKDELDRLQVEIESRKRFLDMWTPYM